MITYNLILTALTPISHHDPAVQDGSNQLQFNRQKQSIQRPALSGETTTGKLLDLLSVPNEIVDLMNGMTKAEFVAVAFTKTFIEIYNSMDGTGLFSGVGRYQMLESRLRYAAIRSNSLRKMWATVCTDLQFPLHPLAHDEIVLAFYALPPITQQSAIAAIVSQYRAIVAIARAWAKSSKSDTPLFASDQVSFAPDTAISEASIIEVPTISANSMRHQLVRASGWQHMQRILGIAPPIPSAVEAVFENGGNIKAGAKQPSNSASLGQRVRDMYPLLGLVGGVTESFDLGESNLSVQSWLVCRENERALVNTPANGLSMATVSAFDMLDNVTATRQATNAGLGQMIYNFETLVAGTQFLVRFHLHHLSSKLQHGCLIASLNEWAKSATIAGQSARGYGFVDMHLCDEFDTDALMQYEQYLIDNADTLKAGIMDGTLGCGARVA